jgi:hypothetical protein
MRTPLASVFPHTLVTSSGLRLCLSRVLADESLSTCGLRRIPAVDRPKAATRHWVELTAQPAKKGEWEAEVRFETTHPEARVLTLRVLTLRVSGRSPLESVLNESRGNRRTGDIEFLYHGADPCHACCRGRGMSDFQLMYFQNRL